MSNPASELDLLDALSRGVLVVTPNHRAARTLRRAFNDRQQAAGLRAWDAPRVLAWIDWTRSLWSDLAVRGHELRVLLNTAQEHLLWRETIEASTASRTLSSPDALAEMARTAWSLAAAHQATGRIRTTATTFDSRTFAAWAESFRKTCSSENLLSTAELDDALRSHARSGASRLDGSVLLAGFEERTPAQSSLIEALGIAGGEISEVGLESSQTGSRASAIVPTTRDEIVLAARWIRRVFAEYSPGSPVPRVAVLLPQPQESRAEIESVFREVLAPELQPIGTDNSAAPWEFITGTPLMAQPMIVSALTILRLVQGQVQIEPISALLRSPYIGSTTDYLPAARFDAQVLRRGPYLLPEFDLEGLTHLIQQHVRSGRSPIFAAGWIKALNDLRSVRLRGPASRSYADWSELMRELLRVANWPGERPPTPSEFSTAGAWDATLDLLATLDYRGTRVTFSTALKTLEQLLESAHVQAPATQAPIQIMAPEQAEGSVFDAVVMLHATDETWPEPTHLHPLLGWPLQQELQLPGSNAVLDAERALKRAESLLRRSANVLVVSAATDERGPLRSSPLLQRLGIPSVSPQELVPPGSPASPIEEEIVPDDVALPPLPSPELRGGASVLRLQAACGFRAFAEMRLDSATVDACELGLDASERGNLVHRALDNFWSATQSQSELRSLSSDERNRRLDNAIDAAFARLAAPAAGWASAYIRIQRERLRRLLFRWLEIELQRGAFTVQQREERTTIPIGPLRLKVQPDRIDEVEGGVVLVDYKTGHQAKPANWLGDRPDDPQLPLYALLMEPDKLQALLFGRVRPGTEMEWKGLAANQTVLPSKKRQKLVDLELRRSEWEAVLTVLAEDFAQGHADVSPKNIAVTCEGCPQRLLCRIDPAAFANTTVEDENEEEFDV